MSIQAYRVTIKTSSGEFLGFEPNHDCIHFDDLLDFAGHGRGGLEVPFIRPEQLNVTEITLGGVPFPVLGNRSSSMVQIPVIHFHQKCKLQVVHKVFVKHYSRWTVTKSNT